MVASVPDEGKANDGIVNLALQCGALPLADIALDVELLAAVIDQFDLLAVFLCGGRLHRTAQTVGQGERWLHVPGGAEIYVVIGDSALVKRVSKRRIKGQVGTCAGICNL